MRMRLAFTALVLPLAIAATAAAVDYPLGSSRIIMADGAPAKRKIQFQAHWTGALDPMPDLSSGATLRITGGTGEGDSGLITLSAAKWHQLPKGAGFRYSDKSATAGGIRTVLVKTTKHGGKVKIAGGSARWAYRLQKAPSTVVVLLRLGDAQLCAQFDSPRVKGKRLRGKAAKAPAACPSSENSSLCQQEDSTWAAVQTAIFANHGCTSSSCHGGVADPTTNGTLVLTPDVAYANLIRVPSYKDPSLNRIEPGGKQNSFLYLKLLAGAGQYDLNGRGSPMPLTGTPLSQSELEALGAWIHAGAPKVGIVQGTEALFGTCTPPPATPPSIDPPPPPPPSEGVQFHAPAWTIEPAGTRFPLASGLKYGANGEDEVCYATYFDLTKDPQIALQLVDCPAYWNTITNPSGKCFYFNHDELTQEPNSHHSIIHMYRGQYDVTESPGGHGFDFQCHDGEKPTGVACDPRLDNPCPSGQECHGAVKSSLACLTFGPPDFTSFNAALQGTGGSTSPAFSGSQQPYLDRVYPPGVYGILPAQGVIGWNSHAFNTFDVPVQNQQWLNMYFAPPQDRQKPALGIFDSTDIFVENVPPFQKREYCRTITFGTGTRIFDLSSHNHKRGVLFRVFAPPIATSCVASDPTCTPESTTPILVSTQYNDPAQVHPDPPMALDSPDPAQRRLKFCAVYDNGASDPSTVKRNSTSPMPPTFGNLAPGGPCYYTDLAHKLHDGGIACLDGPKKGQPCHGHNSECDSSPGAGDGVCDACPVLGGVTTEDEMFILLGTYYCEPSVPGQTCSTTDPTN
jgi:hypothetical protein